jgi:flagellar biosynthesis GTPase FlhF
MARADQARNVDDCLAPRPSRVGNAPRFLKDEIRKIAFGLARVNHSAEFIVAAIVGLAAGWSAFSGYGYFAARAAAGRPLEPAGQAVNSRPMPPSASPLCNSRSRRSSRRRLAREAAKKELAAGAQQIRDAEAAEQVAQQIRDADTAEQVAQQIRDADTAAKAAQQIRDAEAAEQVAQQIRDAEAAAAQQIRDAEAAKQAAKQAAAAAQYPPYKASEAVTQALHRREFQRLSLRPPSQAAVDRLRQETEAMGTSRRWQWARVDGRLSRTVAQRRQDATAVLEGGTPAHIMASGALRLSWGRFDARSPGRKMGVTLGWSSPGRLVGGGCDDRSDS